MIYYARAVTRVIDDAPDFRDCCLGSVQGRKIFHEQLLVLNVPAESELRYDRIKSKLDQT